MRGAGAGTTASAATPYCSLSALNSVLPTEAKNFTSSTVWVVGSTGAGKTTFLEMMTGRSLGVEMGQDNEENTWAGSDSFSLGTHKITPVKFLGYHDDSNALHFITFMDTRGAFDVQMEKEYTVATLLDELERHPRFASERGASFGHGSGSKLIYVHRCG